VRDAPVARSSVAERASLWRRATKAVADEFGSRHRPRPLVPTPKAGERAAFSYRLCAACCAGVAREHAENAAVSCSSYFTDPPRERGWGGRFRMGEGVLSWV